MLQKLPVCFQIRLTLVEHSVEKFHIYSRKFQVSRFVTKCHSNIKLIANFFKLMLQICVCSASTLSKCTRMFNKSPVFLMLREFYSRLCLTYVQIIILSMNKTLFFTLCTAISQILYQQLPQNNFVWTIIAKLVSKTKSVLFLLWQKRCTAPQKRGQSS